MKRNGIYINSSLMRTMTAMTKLHLEKRPSERLRRHFDHILRLLLVVELFALHVTIQSRQTGTFDTWISKHCDPHLWRAIGRRFVPYVLRNEKGQLLENIWQFAKIYRRVEAQRTMLSRFHPDKIIWTHGAEQHIVGDDNVTREYWVWRKKGMDNAYAVRYPAGFKARRGAVASLWIVDGQLRWLDYIAARKHIYCGEYIRLAQSTPHFHKLRELLASGANLQIVEVDGPDPTLSDGPYASISVDSPGLLMDDATCKFLLNDPRRAFGHGFVIAALLLGGAHWMLPDDD
jgi:hypothetical protein